jgi:hypothetical protein
MGVTIRRGLDLLRLYTPLELHFTGHWNTQTSVLSVLQSILAVSWQRI